MSSASDCVKSPTLIFYSFGALTISRKLDENEIFKARNNLLSSIGNNYFLDILCFLKLFQSFTINSRFKTKLQTPSSLVFETLYWILLNLQCVGFQEPKLDQTPDETILNALNDHRWNFLPLSSFGQHLALLCL